MKQSLKKKDKKKQGPDEYTERTLSEKELLAEMEGGKEAFKIYMQFW